MDKIKAISYVAEINLKSKSAYKHQVLKMCDAFSAKGYKVNLYLINSSNIDFSKLKKNHKLKSKFEIIQIFSHIKNLNFFSRIFFSIKIFFLLKSKGGLIYSRSVMTSMILSIFSINNILEIHQPNSGFTKILFNFFKKSFIQKNVKFVFINKNLNKKFLIPKGKFLIVDDGVDLRDFNEKIKIKNFKSCVYTGSLYYGKGIELILKLAKKLNSITFHIYGDLKTASKKTIIDSKGVKNIKFFGFREYSQIPKILKSYKIILMPYMNTVYGSHKTMNIAKYMSPLKLFDYLAAGRVIIASKNASYSHILKNKKNCLLCSEKNLNQWKNNINLSLAKSFNFKKIQLNSLKTAKIFSWDNRINKIIRFMGEINI